MIDFTKIAGALMLVIALSSCTSMGTLDSNVAPPDDSHTLFVIGVQPQNVRVMIFRGDVADGKFTKSGIAAATFFGAPQNGFILGETHAGSTLAVVFVSMPSGPNDISAPLFAPCGEAKTIVFNSPPGKVVYVGSATYRPNGNGFLPDYHNDLGAAQKFISENYPRLAGSLESSPYDLMPTTMRCATD